MVKVVHFDAGTPAGGAFERVAVQMKETMARPEMADAPHEAVLKESIKSIAEHVPEAVPEVPEMSPIGGATPAAVPPAQKNDEALPSYLQKGDADPKSDEVKKVVEALVGKVFSSGLDDAIRAARKYDPFIEDAFHDALTEHMLPEMKRRGLLQ